MFWLAISILLLSIAIFTAISVNQYRDAFEDAERITEDTSRTLAEHAARFFRSNDLILKRAVDLIGVPDWTVFEPSRRQHRALREIASDLPHESSIQIFDNKADAQLSSLMFPAQPMNARERSYFHEQERRDRGFYIGELIMGLLTNAPSFTLSRRLRSDDGSFTGIASIAVAPTDLTRFYESIDLGVPAIFELVRADDMRLLVRSPAPPGETMPGEAIMSARKGKVFESTTSHFHSGLLRGISPVDGVEYINAFRHVEGAPLVVNVRIPVEAIEGAWRSATLAYGAVGFLALAVSLPLCWLTMRQMHALRLGRDTLERRVGERTQELRSLLCEREMLVREIHHRVKNNLQVVMSLLTFESMRDRNQGREELFSGLLWRLQAMSLVHQMLYQSRSIDRIDVSAYLTRLGEVLVRGYETGTDVEFHFDGPPVFTSLEIATPMGQIANEIITNALKHGFEGRRTGTIRMMLEPARDAVVLRIVDDGCGIDPDLPDGFGLKIVRGSVRQLGGTCCLSGGNGTQFELTIPRTDGERQLFDFE